jgi:hypothetical protein
MKRKVEDLSMETNWKEFLTKLDPSLKEEAVKEACTLFTSKDFSLEEFMKLTHLEGLYHHPKNPFGERSANVMPSKVEVAVKCYLHKKGNRLDQQHEREVAQYLRELSEERRLENEYTEFGTSTLN